MVKHEPDRLSLRQRLGALYHNYQGQFWLMFVGMFISTIGASMIWPFLMLYVSKRLDAPLTVVASLLTLNSIFALLSSLLGGPLIDRLGRKWMMVISLAMNGSAYIFLGHAVSFQQFAILLSITGAFNPLYRTAADAMLADLVPPEKRPDAYALLRMSNNLGIAIGPVIGGFVATTSYTLAFYGAAAGMISYSLLVAFFARETLPAFPRDAETAPRPKERLAGYPAILRDMRFSPFVLTFALVTICATLMWTLMPVYANRTFGVPENVYKWVPATNAIMVVAFQAVVTHFTKRFAPLPVLAVGLLFYAFGVGSVALATGFWGFWLCMVIMTTGELILVPTSSTYVANLAPADKRGRYMSLYALTWPVSSGLGPLFGGLLNDVIGPRAIWIGGMLAGLASSLFFTLLSRKNPASRPVPDTLSAAD